MFKYFILKLKYIYIYIYIIFETVPVQTGFQYRFLTGFIPVLESSGFLESPDRSPDRFPVEPAGPVRL